MTEQEIREKVVNGLMCIAGDVVFCAHCKYSDVKGSGRGDRCKRDCAKDAIALLKAQEPVEPTTKNGAYFCGNPHCRKIIAQMVPCGASTHRVKYCSECGRKVKWE